MDMENFIDLDKGMPFETADFIQFVRARRSHRQFKDKAIDQKDLETLADLCRYAPTGSNRQMVELDIIQDSEKLQRLSDYTVDFFEENINRLKTSPDEKIIFQGRLIPPDLVETLKRVIMARKFGLEVIFHKAPVVMIFHCPPNVSCPKDDCVIASTTVTLAARCMGLDTCYIGLFEFAANEYEPIVKELDLPPGNQVFSVLILGYPKLKFYRTVDRKPMRVRWV
jgi:nitroreductase